MAIAVSVQTETETIILHRPLVVKVGAHPQKQLAQWAVDITAQFYACWLRTPATLEFRTPQLKMRDVLLLLVMSIRRP